MQFIQACGHGEYLQHLRNNFLDGKDIYPKKILDAFAIMDQRIPNRGAPHTSIITNNNDINTGIAFPTRSTSTTKSMNSGLTTQSDVTTCNTSHDYMPPPDNGEYHLSDLIHSTYTHSGITFSMQCDHTIPMTWILLDNQATVDVFGNATLLHSIHDITTPLHIRGITGVEVITRQGNLPGHRLVWYHPHVSVNILSMAKLKQQYHITYDSDKENAFIVREPNTTHIKYIFKESHDGLYYHDLNNIQQVFITTVTENKQRYSQSDIKRADGVRTLHKIIGHPTARHLSHLLDHHLISNSPFTSHDMRRAEQIYCPDLGNLKGKTTQCNPQQWIISYNNVHPQSLNNTVTSCSVLIFCM